MLDPDRFKDTVDSSGGDGNKRISHLDIQRAKGLDVTGNSQRQNSLKAF